MKKLRLILLSITVAFMASVYAQGPSPYLTFAFSDPMIISGTPDTLQFDVSIKCDVSGTYQSDLQVGIYYNPAAFGSDVVTNNKVFLQKIGLSAGQLAPGFPFYNIIGPGNTASNLFTFATEQNLGYTTAALNEVTTSFQPYMRVKMVIADNTELAGLYFAPSWMDDGQLYILNSGEFPSVYGISAYDNDLLNFPLAAGSTDLLFSEIASPSNSSATFVEIYNYGATDVNFASFPWFVTRENDGGGTYASVQLTGIIPAGGTYVVAGDETNFLAAYPGMVADQYDPAISGAGTDAYFLSTDAAHGTGTDIDVYGVDNQSGTGQAWGYIGSHAVRHYPILTHNTTWTASEWVVSSAENIDMTPGSHHATLIWNGSTDTEWRDPSNWTAAYVPDAGHNVDIPTAASNSPVISTGDNAILQ